MNCLIEDEDWMLHFMPEACQMVAGGEARLCERNHRMQTRGRIQSRARPGGTPEVDEWFTRPFRDAILRLRVLVALIRWLRSPRLASPPASFLGASGTGRLGWSESSGMQCVYSHAF
jgi:hypothetical protein